MPEEDVFLPSFGQCPACKEFQDVIIPGKGSMVISNPNQYRIAKHSAKNANEVCKGTGLIPLKINSAVIVSALVAFEEQRKRERKKQLETICEMAKSLKRYPGK